MNAGLSLVEEERRHQEIDWGAGIGVSAQFAGQQIYRNERVLLACDADLVNEDDLIEEIGFRSEAFEVDGAAALMAALYDRFGGEFVSRMRGGFSVVLWDRVERLLLAAIDGFGIKRLVYYQDEKGLMIASRIDAIARTGELDLTINPKAIVNVLNFSASLAPETIFTRVQRVSPGSLLIASDGHVRVDRYWDLRYGVGRDSNEMRLSRELESVVERSVAAHCKRESFAGLGAYLSGGTDSSTVVGMMTRAAGGRRRRMSARTRRTIPW